MGYHLIIVSYYHNIKISSYHIIISSNHHLIISSYHHIIISSQRQMVEVIFGAKSRVSTHIESFTPPPRKSPQKIGTLRAITFYDASAIAGQKILAPPKPHFFEKKIGPENFCKKKSKWLKSFLVPSQRFRHILSRLPPLQGSLPKSKGPSGND